MSAGRLARFARIAGPRWHCGSFLGFTLTELFVVIGIVSLVVSFLLPAIQSAQQQARNVTCLNNVRQVTIALINCGSSSGGLLPPSTSTSPARYWYDFEHAGQYMGVKEGQVLGPSVTCPDDVRSRRSYAMNVWASRRVDASVFVNGKGQLWKLNTKNSSRMILVAEQWSTFSMAGGVFVAPPFIGSRGATAGQRFGVGGGIPTWNTRFGPVRSELPFYRHRSRAEVATVTQPVGRVNLGFADGHAAPFDSKDLASTSTGLSRLEVLWGPMDITAP